MTSAMALRMSCFGSLLVMMLMRSVVGQDVFDVTEYGAVADGKTINNKAFLDAWKASCDHKGSPTFLVPDGTFLLGPVELEGPCPNNVVTKVSIEGTLEAKIEPKEFVNRGWIELNELHQLIVDGGGTLDGQGAKHWPLKEDCPKGMNCKNFPTSIRLNKLNNATISNLHLLNSKGFHMNFHKCENIQVHRLKITAPDDSPNTDGIHISATNNITITDSKIGTGDDCISIGPGTTNINIEGITCGPGHGISVGSLGKYKNEKDVVGLTVRNCTLTSTDNGLRLKTWPGSQVSKALNITFEDVVMKNVSNPIIINQEYCPHSDCDNKAPSLVKIANVVFRHVRGTSSTPVAVNLLCSKKVPCENVKLEDISLKNVDGEVATSECSNVKATFSGLQEPTPCHWEKYNNNCNN